MLVELTIRNFTIIPHLTISFREGLHVLTGETGAGKSILIDAISLLIGGRASTDFIRQGESKSEIEGLFYLSPVHPVHSLCQSLGIELEENSLILRRDISKQGKSICRINGKLVTLAILREIGQQLVDIHGQYEHQSMLREESHLLLLDTYGLEHLEPHLKEYRILFKKFKQIKRTIQQLTQNEQQMVQRLDLLRYQLNEIVAANLELGEDISLEQEKRKKIHGQKLFKHAQLAYHAVMDDGGAIASVATLLHSLQEMAMVDEELKPYAETAENIYYQLEELGYTLRDYGEKLDFDPEQLNQMEGRLMHLDQLKRKYGSSIEAIMEYAATIEEELESIEHREERLEELERAKEELIADLALEADYITKIRTKIAQQLVEEIHLELQGLYMDQAIVDIQIVPLQQGEKITYQEKDIYLKDNGWDEVQFLIATNPGEGLKPLAKVASGGELSRFMLALKTVFAKVESVCTLIFDEVDTGVSGRVAQAMAEKLYAISHKQQVICITHQAQVAAMADEHYHIQKVFHARGTTSTTVHILAEAEKMNELARMMSGSEVTQLTKQHASELLASASILKDQANKIN